MCRAGKAWKFICGCPGTGKSLSMEKVRQHLVHWEKEAGFQPPDVLAINCTSLSNTSEIFSKILGKYQPKKKTDGSASNLQLLQTLYSQQQPSSLEMMLIIADELDYLITKDQVLHDLFMLTTFLFSRRIMIGIANSIDLADLFLPRLQALSCKTLVVTFRAYSKDQILKILQERLMVLPHVVFHPQALELCARKVVAASGDMRKALCVCRSAIDILEAELREPTCDPSSCSADSGLSQQIFFVLNNFSMQQVKIDHMAFDLPKAYRSPVVDNIQSLPQHEQITLCSALKIFCQGKKGTTIEELNKSYLDICKSKMIPAVGISEFLSMCRVLSNQGLLKLSGRFRGDKLKRVTLKIDQADITFALQGIRVFRNCLSSSNKYIDSFSFNLKLSSH